MTPKRLTHRCSSRSDGRFDSQPTTGSERVCEGRHVWNLSFPCTPPRDCERTPSVADLVKARVFGAKRGVRDESGDVVWASTGLSGDGVRMGGQRES